MCHNGWFWLGLLTKRFDGLICPLQEMTMGGVRKMQVSQGPFMIGVPCFSGKWTNYVICGVFAQSFHPSFWKGQF